MGYGSDLFLDLHGSSLALTRRQNTLERKGDGLTFRQTAWRGALRAQGGVSSRGAIKAHGLLVVNFSPEDRSDAVRKISRAVKLLSTRPSFVISCHRRSLRMFDGRGCPSAITRAPPTLVNCLHSVVNSYSLAASTRSAARPCASSKPTDSRPRTKKAPRAPWLFNSKSRGRTHWPGSGVVRPPGRHWGSHAE
jgi:hypothetical protein